MSDPRLRPLEPELDALLGVERAATPPKAALDRVWSRVTQSMGPSGETPNGGNASGPGWLASHARVVVALAFLGGGAVGAGLHAMLHPRAPERIVYIERPAPSATTAKRMAAAAPTPSASSSPDVAPQLSPPRPSSAHGVPVPSASSSLSAERAILDNARAALAQDDGARALTWTDEHTRRFAHPQLGEEREAIAIQALIFAGRYAEARARAARFAAATPNSLFLPAVEASLASIP